MSELDYILAQDLARVRVLIDTISDVNGDAVHSDCPIPEAEREQMISKLIEWRRALEAVISTDDKGGG